MGIAIKLTESDFSENNLGTVTFLAGSIEGLTISGSATIASDETSAQYSIVYDPVNTEETGVTWSVETGDDIASIDSDGLLTIETNRAAQTVVIRATSVYNSSVYDDFTISVEEHTSFYADNGISVFMGYYSSSGSLTTITDDTHTYYKMFYTWNPLTEVDDGNYQITIADGYKIRVIYSTDNGETLTRVGWLDGTVDLSDYLPNGGLFALTFGKKLNGAINQEDTFDLDTSGAESLFRIDYTGS